MKFGPVPVGDAVGGIVAHSIRQDGVVLKKGETVSSAHAETLAAQGLSQIVVAQLEAGDLDENAAALRLAQAIAGPRARVETPFTGRSNLFAEAAGVLVVDAAAIDAVNFIDERVTVATLPAWRSVVAGEMIATVKIIPFAVPGEVVARICAQMPPHALHVEAFRPLRVGVVSTLLPGLKPSVVAKTLRVLQDRLDVAGAKIAAEARVPHETQALTQAIARMRGGCDLLIVFGASAITDRRDVIPAAVEAAGGAVRHFGMPVDPGNLLLVGGIDGAHGRIPVLGAPGCARSPKENGFDWVLHRLLAGIDVSAHDIQRMGVGGLLMEIVARGMARDGSAHSGDE